MNEQIRRLPPECEYRIEEIRRSGNPRDRLASGFTAVLRLEARRALQGRNTENAVTDALEAIESKADELYQSDQRRRKKRR